MRDDNWVRLLAYVTGLVNQELLLQNEYLAIENPILKAHLPSRVRLANSERANLAEIGKRLGRKALRDVACIAKPDTILAWYRKLIARKFDGSKQRRRIGRPPVNPDVAELVVRFARENPGWGYDRIVGALGNLGHQVSDRWLRSDASDPKRADPVAAAGRCVVVHAHVEQSRPAERSAHGRVDRITAAQPFHRLFPISTDFFACISSAFE